MFYLIGGELGPEKKASGTIYNVSNTKYIKYVATPARESYVGYLKGSSEPFGAITVRSTIIKNLDTYTENVKGAGDYQSILEATGTVKNTQTEWLIENFVRDKKPKGNTFNVKGFEYEPIDVASSYSNIDITNLENKIASVTEAIYKVRPLKDVLSESGMVLDWLNEKNYKVIYTRKDFMNFLEGLKNYDDSKYPVGFDTETSGLLINRHKLDVLVGICMSYEDHAGVYIPLQHSTMNNIDMPMEEVLELLKPYIDSRSKYKKALLTHNGKFDWGVLKMYDIELNIVHDTLTKQAVLNIGKTGTLMKLKRIAEDVLGYDVLELEDLYEYPSSAEFKALQNAVRKGLQCDSITKRKLLDVENATPTEIKKNMFDFRFASEEFVEIYGPADADFPRLIFKHMEDEWNRENEKENGKLEFIYNIEIAMIPVLGEQEFYGVKVIKEEFENLHRNALQEMENLKTKIYAETGQEFKIGGKDTAHMVYDVCKVPYNSRYKTKSGERSVDKNALEYFTQFTTNDGEPMYPITNYLQKYNKIKTLVSSFYSKLPKLVIKDFIFPQYNNIRAETGRLTCSNPNIQQTEPSSRKFMVAEDGYYFMICDYSQVEYRLMNGLAGEQKVIDFFKNDSEADYHIMAYSNMHGIPYAKVTSKQRKEGKKLNFGTSYGLQDKALALALFGDDDEAAQIKAHEARAKYFAGVPKVLEYFEKQRDIAQETCYARTKFGRRRYIPQFAEAKKATGRKKDMLISKGRRVAGNMPVQGLAADIMKMAMIRIRANFRKYGYYEDKARMVLNVHDEVCVQVHKSLHPDLVIKIMREAMEIDFSKWGFPPLYVGGNVGYNWKDGKADDLEAPVALMDRMMLNAKEHLTKNEPFEYLEDPREYWREEIIKYNLEVLDTQSKIGYIDPDDPEAKRILPIHDMDDALKSVRIAKYTTHDAYKVDGVSRGNFILGMVMLKGHEFVWENLDYLLNNGADFSINLLNKASLKYSNFEDAKKSLALRTASEWFNGIGGFGGDILNFALKDKISNIDFKTVGKGKSKHTVCMITNVNGDITEIDKPIYSLKPTPKKLVGKELEETQKSLKDEVDSLFSFDEQLKMLDLNADKIQPKTLSKILDLMIETRQLNNMLKDKNTKTYNVQISIANVEDKYVISSKRLLADFIPIIKELIYDDFVGIDNFSTLDSKVSEIAMKNFK